MYYLIGSLAALGFAVPVAIVVWSWAIDKAMDVYTDWWDD